MSLNYAANALPPIKNKDALIKEAKAKGFNNLVNE